MSTPALELTGLKKSFGKAEISVLLCTTSRLMCLLLKEISWKAW